MTALLDKIMSLKLTLDAAVNHLGSSTHEAMHDVTPQAAGAIQAKMQEVWKEMNPQLVGGAGEKPLRPAPELMGTAKGTVEGPSLGAEPAPPPLTDAERPRVSDL